MIGLWNERYGYVVGIMGWGRGIRGWGRAPMPTGDVAVTAEMPSRPAAHAWLIIVVGVVGVDPACMLAGYRVGSGSGLGSELELGSSLVFGVTRVQSRVTRSTYI